MIIKFSNVICRGWLLKTVNITVIATNLWLGYSSEISGASKDIAKVDIYLQVRIPTYLNLTPTFEHDFFYPIKYNAKSDRVNFYHIQPLYKFSRLN